jgi:hypothetical protein
LTEKLKQKELLRRVHLLHPTLLPENLIEAIKPSDAEMDGTLGLVSKKDLWKCHNPHPGHHVTVKLHGSSDGVRLFKTGKSSVRCIMASLDYIESEELGIKVYIPDSPPFLVGVYKGEDKNSDVVLKPLVWEMHQLTPPGRRLGKQVHAWFSFNMYYFNSHQTNYIQ